MFLDLKAYLRTLHKVGLLTELGRINFAYTVDGVDERVVTAVAHCQPMTEEKDYVDVTVPGTNWEDYPPTPLIG